MDCITLQMVNMTLDFFQVFFTYEDQVNILPQEEIEAI